MPSRGLACHAVVGLGHPQVAVLPAFATRSTRSIRFAPPDRAAAHHPPGIRKPALVEVQSASVD
jgi:hypothetical protein